jgi:hypothetical protein
VTGLAVDPSDLTTVYAATGRGVVKSTDRGDTWASASSGLPTKLDPHVITCGGDPANCNHDQNVDLANFTVPQTVQSIAIDPVKPDVLYAGIGKRGSTDPAVGGIYTSADGGATWTSLNGNLSSMIGGTVGTRGADVASGDVAVLALVVDRGAGADPIWGTLFAATEGAGIFRGTRAAGGAVTWTQVNQGITDAADRFITALVIDPLPAGNIAVYAGTRTGKVFKTITGTSWTSLSEGLPGSAVTALAFEMADPKVIYAALDGAGVYASSDGGFTWAVKNSNDGLATLDVVGFAVDTTLSPHALYAATRGRGMHYMEMDLPGHPNPQIISPAPPYPSSSSTSPIEVTLGVIEETGTSTVLWSTNRAHAGVATAAGPNWTASIPLEPGLNVITLTAIDTDSNEGSTSITVDFALPPDTTAPTVTVNASAIASNSVTFSWSATDDQPGSLEYRYMLDGVDAGWSGWGTTTQKAYSSLPTSTNRTFTVEARDLATNVGVGTRNITLQACPVQIGIDNKPPGQSNGRVAFTGTWTTAPQSGSQGTASLQSAGAGNATYTWMPGVFSTNQQCRYRVEVRWTAAANRGTNVPYVVTGPPAGNKTKSFNQRTGGGVWTLHGTYNFAKNVGATVKVSDKNGGRASADNARFILSP